MVRRCCHIRRIIALILITTAILAFIRALLVPGCGQVLRLKVLSSRSRVSIQVNGDRLVVPDGCSRGLHVVVLHQLTGVRMAHRCFDTFAADQHDHVSFFIHQITAGRIVVLAVQDEASLNMGLPLKRFISNHFGSRLIHRLAWRDMWALVAIANGSLKAEGHSSPLLQHEWAPPVVLSACLQLRNEAKTEADFDRCPERFSPARKRFCQSYEGYGSLCRCSWSSPRATPTADAVLPDVPVMVVASHRPHYLFRMLTSLLAAVGSDPDKIVLAVDGADGEVALLSEALGVPRSFYSTSSISRDRTKARVSQHYKSSLAKVFRMFPDASEVIVLEEDLDVSPDFFLYFAHTRPLLKLDSSLYCISAWNDQGYKHTSGNAELLYRVETMPGLGWMLSRQLFQEELEPNWPTPDKLWDWDMWLRTDDIRKGRECIVPDVSRTFHFGSSGMNINPMFQLKYFEPRIFNQMANVAYQNISTLTLPDYDYLLASQIRSGIVDPLTFVLYIRMEHGRDFKAWLTLARSLGIWDLDARGFHRSVWRLWMHHAHLIVIGYPHSSFSRGKPAEVTALDSFTEHY